MTPERMMVHRYLDLPQSSKWQICEQFGLSQADQRGPTMEVARRLFQRIKLNGQVADLWDAVEKAHGTQEPNPFRKVNRW